MQITQNYVFAHTSLVQAWRIIIFGRNFCSEWFASKVKLQKQQISTYVFDHFTNLFFNAFLCLYSD